MPNPPSLFPWSVDGEGLCPALEEPVLWDMVFDREKFATFRKVIVGAFHHASPLFHSLVQKSADRIAATDSTFADDFVKALRGKRSREKLIAKIQKGYRKQTWNKLVARELFLHLHQHHQPLLPALETICEERGKKGWYLQTQKWSGWLTKSEPEEEATLPLTRFGCAFAILQPEDSVWILNALASCGPKFQRLLGGPAPASLITPPLSPLLTTSADTCITSKREDQTAPLNTPALTHDNETVPEEKGCPEVELPLGRKPQAQQQRGDGTSLTSDGDWSAVLPVREYQAAIHELRTSLEEERIRNEVGRAFLNQLGGSVVIPNLPERPPTDDVIRLGEIDNDIRALLSERVQLGFRLEEAKQKRLTRGEERLRQLASAKSRLQEQLVDVAALPWFGGQIIDETPVTENEPWKEVEQSLADQLSLVSHVLQADTTLRQLTAQLGEEPRVLGPVNPNRLNRVAEVLAHAVEEYSARLKEVAEKEKAATDFLLKLAAAGSPEHGVRLVHEASPEVWEVVVRLLLDQPPRTVPPDLYPKLERDDRLAGLAFAWLWTLDLLKAIHLLPEIVVLETGDPARKRRRGLLGFLTWSQLQRACTERGNIAVAVVEQLLAATFRSGDWSTLSYLEPISKAPTLSTACGRFCRALLDVFHSNDTAQLESLRQPAKGLMRPQPTPASLRHAPRTPTVEALEALQHEAKTEQHLEVLLQTICLVQMRPTDSTLPGATFGEGLAVEESGRLTLALPDDLVTPMMTWCWAEVTNGMRCPADLILADLLRHALGSGPSDLRMAVDAYWEAGDFSTAVKAASADKQLTEELAARVAMKRADLRTAHTKLFQDAERFRTLDESVSTLLEEIETCFAGLRFTEASFWLDELGAAVARARHRHDPRRLDFLRFVRDAGRSCHDDTPVEELQGWAEEIRATHSARRTHLVALQLATENLKLPEIVRQRWRELARDLDWPLRWPDPSDAAIASQAVAVFAQYLVGLTEFREADGDPEIDLVVERFADWLSEIIRPNPTLTPPDGTEILNKLVVLSEAIPRFMPPKRVLEHLGRGEQRRLATVPVVPQDTGVGPRGGLRPRDRRQDVAEVYREIRDGLTMRILREPEFPNAQATRLQTTVRGGNWAHVRAHAAALARIAAPGADERPSDFEAVYAVALGLSVSLTDPDLQEVIAVTCLASVAASRGHREHIPPIVSKEHDLIGRALVLLAGRTPFPESITGEDVCDAVIDLNTTAPEASNRDRISNLFRRATRVGDDCAGRLAELAWEALKSGNPKATENARFSLLHLLATTEAWDALTYLTRLAEAIANVLRACLKTFRDTQSDSTAWPYALELLNTLQEQAAGKRNAKAWVRLFQALASHRSEENGPAVRCVPQSDTLIREGATGAGVVQVNLEPAPSDPPMSLKLEFVTDPMKGSATSSADLLPDDDILHRPRVVWLTVPAEAQIAAGDTIDVSFRILGETIQGKRIDIRDRWTFSHVAASSGRLAQEVVIRTWPGASGAPVEEQSFHGREIEKQKIDRYLCAPGPGQSLMLFGQRRIGKTSLLKEMVRSYPPDTGRIAAVYFDVNSLEIPRQAGEMQHRFFEFVVSKLQHEPLNAPIRQALSRAEGRPVDLETLARGLRPDVSLEDALDGLIEKLGQASEGRVSRVALFIDEFDRFVEPLLSQRRDEVIRLHGSLRQLIQRSKRITLILAGSGLQRLFTDDYLHPFYGSVNEVELLPFQREIPNDQEAAAKTFMPTEVRRKLCPEPERFPEIIHRAYDLCGGHPYFLAMLGYATALAWRGSPVTPEMLNRVTDLMLQNKIDTGSVHLNRKTFYMAVFDSLKRLPQRERAVAKIMLTTIARLTSTQQQRWNKWKLLQDQFVDDPDVRRLTTEDDRQISLVHLERERVIEFDKGRGQVRIRTPLTAAAIREDARELFEEGINDLSKLSGGR